MADKIKLDFDETFKNEIDFFLAPIPISIPSETENQRFLIFPEGIIDMEYWTKIN